MNAIWHTLKSEYIKKKTAQGLSASATTGISNRLKAFERYMLAAGIENLKQITAEELRKFLAFLRSCSRKNPGRKKRIYSPIYIFMIYRTLKYFFDYLAQRGYIDENPFMFVDIKRPSRELPRDILTEREVGELRKAMSSPALMDRRNKTIFELLYNTGMRAGEVTRLDLYDVDFSEGLLYVRKGKGGKNRIIPLNEYILEALNDYVERVRPMFRIMPDCYDVFFVSNSGKRMHRSRISLFIHEYRKRTGITKTICAHSIRHTFATHMLKNGASIRFIQEILGHESLSTTEIYTRVSPDDLRRILNRCHPRAGVPDLKMPPASELLTRAPRAGKKD